MYRNIYIQFACHYDFPHRSSMTNGGYEHATPIEICPALRAATDHYHLALARFERGETRVSPQRPVCSVHTPESHPTIRKTIHLCEWCAAAKRERDNREERRGFNAWVSKDLTIDRKSVV